MRVAGLALTMALAGCGTGVPVPRGDPPADLPPPVRPPAESVAPTVPPDPPGTVRLQCDDGAELRVTFGDDEARLTGLPAGEQVLLRDAGGMTPQQSVYSSSTLRAEFGLGPDARDADLQFLDSRARLHCVRR